MSPPGIRPTALIDFRSPDEGAASLRLAFGAPRERLRATSLAAVAPLLARVHALAQEGAWCVGYLCYEAAGAFDEAFQTHAPSDLRRPLAAFAVYDAPLPGEPAFADAGTATVRWTDGPRRDAFDIAIAEILRAIADGQVYQVNATAPLTGTLQGDPLALFAALQRAQPNAYAAYLDLGTAAEPDDRILSVSPELFFDWHDDRLLARPMKGTAPRGATPEEDAAQSAFLRSAAKERAENLMIVDLLRNDVSRIAEPHSVRVPRLFHTEAWPTVWQMSSDVVATTRPHTTLADVFGALFPCGSITGAPKVQAMRLINELEPEPRGIYCGAIGVVQPGGAATFNVPIRTLALREEGAMTRVRCGIGSGITADATAAGEWDEWRHKRAFVDRASQAFELLETLRLEQGVFADVDAHLARLREAAAHFAFASPAAAAQRALDELGAAHPGGRWRVRLLADRAGAARAQAYPLAPTQAPVRVTLAPRPLVGSDGEFVRFKTTHRAHYDAFAPSGDDVFDTLLWNERGELTEFTRGNVALHLDGRWLTPASRCGLLRGVARARLLREGRIEEATLTRADLARADGLAFFNSLRGWIEARLIPAAA
ncbi:MAG: aminodeoxychorismate synthase component I [Vitreoscilla sp.]